MKEYSAPLEREAIDTIANAAIWCLSLIRINPFPDGYFVKSKSRAAHKACPKGPCIDEGYALEKGGVVDERPHILIKEIFSQLYAFAPRLTQKIGARNDNTPIVMPKTYMVAVRGWIELWQDVQAKKLMMVNDGIERYCLP